ncbi:conserved hypothetical protein, partial [Trichinella spiralis]|uniref:hypothetical protein n=1 Tax=Trichinella spiralis TaxID=6334 RepID=UPI0001EFE843
RSAKENCLKKKRKWYAGGCGGCVACSFCSEAIFLNNDSSATVQQKTVKNDFSEENVETSIPDWENERIFENEKPVDVSDFSEKVEVESYLSEHSKASRVPSSRIGRMASFGNLAVKLGFGALAEVTRRSFKGRQEETNRERLVSTLCRARGAALSLSVMIIVREMQRIFERVRCSGDFMPASHVNVKLKVSRLIFVLFHWRTISL